MDMAVADDQSVKFVEQLGIGWEIPHELLAHGLVIVLPRPIAKPR